MKKRKLIFKIVGKTQGIIKVVGKTQKKVDPLKVAKALGAEIVGMGKVNIPFYYAPQKLEELRNSVKKRLKKLKKKKR